MDREVSLRLLVVYSPSSRGSRSLSEYDPLSLSERKDGSFRMLKGVERLTFTIFLMEV